MTQPFVGTHSETGWEDWHLENIETTPEGVTLAPDSLPAYRSPETLLDGMPAEGIVDLAVEPCGDLLVLSTDGFVYRYDVTSSRLRRLPCFLDDGLAVPRAIAVTDDTIYIAEGETDEGAGDGQLHAFSSTLLQRRFRVSESVTNPLALAAWCEGVVVLDHSGVNGRINWLSRRGILEAIDTDILEPIDFALDRSGSIYVLAGLDPDDREIIVFELQESESNALPHEYDDPEVLVSSEEFTARHTAGPFEPARIEADHPGEVFVRVDEDAERPVFRRRPTDNAFERLDGELATVTNLVHHSEGEGTLYAIADDGESVVTLAGKYGFHRNPETERYDARIVRRLDSGIERCQWHRLTVGYDRDGGATGIRVRYYATDGPTESIDVETVNGIGPIFGGRLRNAGVGTLQTLSALDATTVAGYASTEAFTVPKSWGQAWIETAEDILDEGDHVNWQRLDVTDPTDVFLPDVEGRYLWVRIELIGGRFTTPALESVRAYFPRQSFLRYLPDVYEQEDARGFLEAYLSVFESVVVDISEAIEGSMGYLDPDGVPADSVRWLADWFGLETDETWSTRSQRDLIRWGPLLAKHRGTRAGLFATIWLYLRDAPTEPDHWEWAHHREREWIEARRDAGDIAPTDATSLLDAIGRSIFLLEHADLDCIDADDALAAYERIVPCGQCFGVFTTPSIEQDSLEGIKRIVRSQQPAHSTGRTMRLRPWIQLSGDESRPTHHTFLGVNSALVEREYVLESAELGTDAVITAVESDGQLGRRGRLGSDTRIS